MSVLCRRTATGTFVRSGSAPPVGNSGRGPNKCAGRRAASCEASLDLENLRARPNLDAGALKALSDRLGPAAQALRENRLRDGMEREVVLRPRKAMALVEGSERPLPNRFSLESKGPLERRLRVARPK